MQVDGVLERASAEGWTDEEVVQRVRAGETALYEILVRRYNQRLYRVARAIMRNDGEAEDVMQDAYVRAYVHLGQFEGRSGFGAWLTKIAVHEALNRGRRGKFTKSRTTGIERGTRPSSRRSASLFVRGIPDSPDAPGHRRNEHGGNSRRLEPDGRKRQSAAPPRAGHDAEDLTRASRHCFEGSIPIYGHEMRPYDRSRHAADRGFKSERGLPAVKTGCCRLARRLSRPPLSKRRNRL